jgi:regulatory protein
MSINLKMMIRKQLTKEESIQKIRHYCQYQDRCHLEVKEKLYSFGLKKNLVEELLAKMIEENSVNEEKFAIAYARGKFRMKKWGKIKIKNELKLRQVGSFYIDTALDGIDSEEYMQTFQKLAAKRIGSLKMEKNILVRKRKLQDYLLRKGYERALIQKISTDR